MKPLIDTPTILIIDDTPSNLSVVVILFEEHGYRVAIAQDGEEGLQRAHLVHPDLILLDVMMPGMDGFEACKQLKASPVTRDTPVIFMTALASSEHKIKGFRAGAVDYVTKPLQIDEVMARVETHLQLHAAQKRLAEHNEALEQRVAARTAELAAREREFRTLVENHPDGIVRLDTEGRHLFASDSALRSVGLSEMELLGKTVCDLPIPGNPEIMRPLFDAYRRARESGKVDVMEFTWPNGRVSEIRHIPEFDGQNKVVSVLAIAGDISERKLAEEALAVREREFRTLAENIPDNIIRYDAQVRKIYVNTAMARLMGVEPESLLNQTPDKASGEVRSIKIAEFAHRVRQVLESGEQQEMEVTLQHAEQGTQVHNVRFVAERDEQGNIAGALVVGRDITELKKVENDLEESRAQLRGLTARREAAREEERKYIAREVHDELGQILTGLKMNISLLEHRFAADSPALRDCLKDTVQLADRSLAVARNVASALRPASLDMGIASALEWLAGRFESNTGISCSTHVDDGNYELSEDGAIALFRIAQESLTNIARHAHASHIEIDLSISPDDYTLKVRDNGCGFDTGRNKLDSFGVLGMRERAIMLDGEFVVESHLGKGTQVMVRIPYKRIEGEI